MRKTAEGKAVFSTKVTERRRNALKRIGIGYNRSCNSFDEGDLLNILIPRPNDISVGYISNGTRSGSNNNNSKSLSQEERPPPVPILCAEYYLLHSNLRIAAFPVIRRHSIVQ